MRNIAITVAFILMLLANYGCNSDLQFTATENWIVERLSNYEIADLNALPANQRTIRGNILSSILRDSFIGSSHPKKNGVIYIKNAIVHGPVLMLNGEIPFRVLLSDCKFDDIIDASGAMFSKEFVMAECHTKKISFVNSVFASGFNFVGNEIDGEYSFSRAKLKDTVKLTGNCYIDPNSTINCNDIVADSSVYLSGNKFAGLVDFKNSEFHAHCYISNSEFTNPKTAISFNGAYIDGTLNISNSSFASDATFNESRIRGNFLVNMTLFRKTASFYAIRVEKTMQVKRVDFMEDAIFADAVISDDLNMTSCRFIGDNFGGYFNSISVNKALRIDNVEANGSLSFIQTNIGSLMVTKCQFNSMTQSISFLLSNMATAFILDSNFAGPTNFNLARITNTFMVNSSRFLAKSSPASFWNMAVKGSVGFAGSTFSVPYNITGLRYDDLVANEGDVVSFLSNSEFNIDAYNTMENNLLSKGRYDESRRVHVLGQRLQRQNITSFHSRLWNAFLDYLLAYGREPIRILIIIVVFIAVGSLVFSPSRMQPSDSTSKSDLPSKPLVPFNRFWYSVDLFIPVIDLRAKKDWVPITAARYTRLWMRIHIICGWIFVTLALVIWTGILK